MANRSRDAMRQFIHEHVDPTRTTKTVVRPYTIVEIYAEINGKVYRGCGLATQGPNDTWNATSQIAHDTAYGHAIAEIRHKLELETKAQAKAAAELRVAAQRLRTAGYLIHSPQLG